jgi:hypothetical protein
VEEFNSQPVDYNLDEFRMLDPGHIRLPALPLIRFGGSEDLTKPWLDASKIPAIHASEIVVSRTERYHSPFDWGVLADWKDRAVFVGTQHEHEGFIRQTGIFIPWRCTNTWMELAGVIRGSKLFIGNQSMAYAIAEGLKHPRVLEVCCLCPNCDPQGTDGHVRLTPEVILKYVSGQKYDGTIRVSRVAEQQVLFIRTKARKRTFNEVSCILVGSDSRKDKFVKEFLNEGIEVIHGSGKTFESAANEGAARATRQIICVVDVDSCRDETVAAATIRGIMSPSIGMTVANMSVAGEYHDPCFCVDRLAYEKAGLFNLALGPGKPSMDEMTERYKSLGIKCGSAGFHCETIKRPE